MNGVSCCTVKRRARGKQCPITRPSSLHLPPHLRILPFCIAKGLGCIDAAA